MLYKITTQLPNSICRICGEKIDKFWSMGGIGAVCQTCTPIRNVLDLVKEGVVRNIKEIPSDNYLNGVSYNFEVLIDNKWYQAIHPCGNWSQVVGYLTEHKIFSVPIGWWELADLYKKHKVTAKRCHRCNNDVIVPEENKVTASCPRCGNNNTYYASMEA